MDLLAEFQADEDTRQVNDEQGTNWKDQWEAVSAVSPLAGTHDTIDYIKARPKPDE